MSTIGTFGLVLSLIFFAGCQQAPTQTTEPVTETAPEVVEEVTEVETEAPKNVSFNVTPISHATGVFEWDGTIIYTDPVGGAEAFEGQPSPDIILMSDVHGDHLSEETVQAVSTENTTIIMPQAVLDELTDEIMGQIVVIANGETTEQQGFTFEAIPMYNLPESEDTRHTKGRGNGYVIEKDGMRIYLSGDTAGIPEMRALQDIDKAFVCMNLPYTMGVEEAADAVLEFSPKQVYPYHYRTPEGFSDVSVFKELVNAGNPEIEVVQLDWYPE